MKVRVGVKTDVGRVRQGNEDSYYIEPPLYAVADGMGGHVAGDVASSTAVEVITQLRNDSLVNDPEKLKDILREANRTIWERASSDPTLRGMGTTCTLLMFQDGKAHFAHVGDSRAYLFRDGELSQVTEDHTLVERMVREGRLTTEEAAHHPQRNIITNALGIDEDVEVDLFSLDLREGDRVIICSDGLTGLVTDGEFEAIMARGEDVQVTAETLVEAALDAGGDDNITVLILELGPGEGVETVAPAEQPATLARADTEPDVDRSRPVQATAAPSRLGRRLLIVGLGLAVLAAAAYFAVRYTLDNSWYVGVNEEGFVTIFRGIPEEIAGMEFRETEEETDIALADLPSFMRSDVREGQKVDSLDEAEETVDNLRDRARDEELQPRTNKKDQNQT